MNDAMQSRETAAATKSAPSHLSPVGRVKQVVQKIRRHHDHSTIDADSTCLPTQLGCRTNQPRRRRRSRSSGGSNETLSLELWTAAYDSLKDDTGSAGLVITYESIISQQLPDPFKQSITGNSQGLPSGDRRLELMASIASAGLNRELSSKSGSDNDTARALLIDARQTVASLLPQNPSAALAWAGICSLTPLLLEPLLKDEDMKRGLTYIADNIPRIMSLSACLRPSAWANQDTYRRLQTHVRRSIMDLYRQILEYQMNCVCAAASAWNMAARNVVDWRGWRKRTEDIAAKDDELRHDIGMHGSEEAKLLAREWMLDHDGKLDGSSGASSGDVSLMRSSEEHRTSATPSGDTVGGQKI